MTDSANNVVSTLRQSVLERPIPTTHETIT